MRFKWRDRPMPMCNTRSTVSPTGLGSPSDHQGMAQDDRVGHDPDGNTIDHAEHVATFYGQHHAVADENALHVHAGGKRIATFHGPHHATKDDDLRVYRGRAVTADSGLTLAKLNKLHARIFRRIS